MYIKSTASVPLYTGEQSLCTQVEIGLRYPSFVEVEKTVSPQLHTQSPPLSLRCYHGNQRSNLSGARDSKAETAVLGRVDGGGV